MRSILRAVLITVLVSYTLVCGGLYLAQEQLIFVPDKLPANHVFAFPNATFEEVQVSSGTVTLSALHFKVAQPKGVVLYFHGNAGSLRGWGAIAPMFTRRNYDLFMLDYRGYGKSSGQLSTEADLHADARAAYDYLRQRFSADQIVIFGRSLGSGVASHLAVSVPARMLILETPYTSLAAVVAARTPFIPVELLMKYPLRTESWIGQVRCPVYIFHGTADDLVPYAHSTRLMTLIHAPHERITLPGGGHGNLASFSEYQTKMIEVLSK